MNIFYLDPDTRSCAEYHCNKHVVKMILEYAQLLSTTHHVLDGPKEGLYKPTHKNHPSAVWVRESRLNYLWLYDLWLEMLLQYNMRYKKVHASARLCPFLKEVPSNIPEGEPWSDPPQCMPDQYKGKSTVQAYREYYAKEKYPICKWTYVETPWWFIPLCGKTP